MLATPCAKCGSKDEKIAKITKKITQLEKNNSAKDAEFEKLNKLVKSQTQTQTPETNTVLGELYKQFGNFISMTEPK